MTQRVIETLSEAECFDLIRPGGVGRFVFEDDDGPAAVPVNFGLADTRIVFRVEQHSNLRAMLERPIAFEVDHVEPETSLGWSVLVRGSGEEVELEHVPELLRSIGDALPKPWAEGIHNVWVAVTARKVTGRRLAEPYFSSIF